MKRFSFLLVALFASLGLFAQDILVERNGFETKVNIIEVGIPEVAYTIYDFPDGPVYRMNMENVHKIIYSDGREKVYAQMFKDADRGYTSRREPGLAALFSILLPGAGQLYNKDYGKSGIMTSLYVGAVIVAGIGYSRTIEFNLFTDDIDSPYYNAAVKMFFFAGIGAFGTWVWSIIDAPVRAGTINRRYCLVDSYLFENKNFRLKIDPYYAMHAIPGYQLNKPIYGATLSLAFK